MAKIPFSTPDIVFEWMQCAMGTKAGLGGKRVLVITASVKSSVRSIRC